MNDAEINVFLNDGAGHIKVMLPSVPAQFDAEGKPSVYAEPDIQRIVEVFDALKKGLEGQGHTLSARKAGGWGGKAGGAKPEEPPPADLADRVPLCCDEKMVYKPKYTNPNTQKEVGAKFQCRKGEACERAESFNGKKFGYSMWEDRYRKELEAEYA